MLLSVDYIIILTHGENGCKTKTDPTINIILWSDLFVVCMFKIAQADTAVDYHFDEYHFFF